MSGSLEETILFPNNAYSKGNTSRGFMINMDKEKKAYVRDMGKIVSDLYKKSWDAAIDITEKDINYSNRGERKIAGIIALTIFRATLDLGAYVIPIFEEKEF